MWINRELSKALNNQMKRTQSSLQKTLGKLSTGQRINAAADDAAGLAISQKLRALQSGTHQAIRNVQDAHSMVQVADGAMQEMTDIVQRIRELTIQAMNGTNTDIKTGSQSGMLTEADTIIVQNEIDDLKKSLNDIVRNTEFNGMKILSNKTPGQYIYEDRTAAKTIQLSSVTQLNGVATNINITGSALVNPNSKAFDPTVTVHLEATMVTEKSQKVTMSTVVDKWPLFTADGSTIVFTSTRDGGKYAIPSDGNSDPVGYQGGGASSFSSIENGTTVYRLRDNGSTLTLEKANYFGVRDYKEIQTFDYNPSGGFSFSPITDSNGITSFVYADGTGNLTTVEFNSRTGTVGASSNLISTTDTLHLPPDNNVVTLKDVPDLYRMNQSDASLKVQKNNDNGARDLHYWDGSGVQPSGGYTVNGNEIEFFGDAIIGSETVDDAQDYYTFSYVKDSSPNNIYTMDIPSGAQIYNMHGEDGPRSMDINIGNRVITKDLLLAERPTDFENVNGVFVNTAENKLEFYGSLRPAHDQDVTVKYMADSDANKQVQTYNISTAIDTYNLDHPDLSMNRSLRIYVGGNEINYDATKTNGYTYDPGNGNISIYGDARSNLTGNPNITVKYVPDTSSTGREVYGLSLGGVKSEEFNLGNANSPNSIRVYKGGVEIPFSNENGFQYNSSTNTIELYGSERPNVGDTYTVRMVLSASDPIKSDNKLEVGLSSNPETYGIQISDIPSTFRVRVDGNEIQYDADKQNGFFYNQETNKIEIYGDARPDAGNLHSPDIEISYVTEGSSGLVGNHSYDIQLSSGTMDYGLQDSDGPTAIRVYHKGEEIPYDPHEGYTYEPSTRRLSLHGSYRPAGGDSQGDYRVYSISSSDLEKTVPVGSYIYKVEMNGQEILQASSTGKGYLFDGNKVQIVGDARPDVNQSMSGIQLNVSYLDSIEIGLDESSSSDFFNSYCEHEVGEGIFHSEIDPEQLTVKLDGNTLNSDQYELNGSRIVLKQETLTLGLGSHNLTVEYRARHAVGYEPNHFTFQVGANAGNTKTVDIASFDNLVRDTSVICVRTFEDAEKGVHVIDHALKFILGELGNIGAAENSFDHIASNLSVMEQTTTESLSRIQDTDMAKEAMQLARLQILGDTQKAIASQEKQAQERVLELLR